MPTVKDPPDRDRLRNSIERRRFQVLGTRIQPIGAPRPTCASVKQRGQEAATGKRPAAEELETEEDAVEYLRELKRRHHQGKGIHLP